MSILKNKVIWFTLYGIFITVMFLYLLFPSDIVKSKLEEAVNSSDFILKTESLKPSLPLGVQLKNITINSASTGNMSFQGDVLDLQLNPASFFQKNKYIKLSGKAYKGSFAGQIGLASFSKMDELKEGNLEFQNIDLGEGVSFIKPLLGAEVTGKAKGSLAYTSAGEGGKNSSGAVALFLTKGSFPLTEPFLGINHIDFERGEMQGKLQNGTLSMEKLEIVGPQINCFLKGEIILADAFKSSRLNLKGTMEILGKNKAKMNVTISGTPDRPVIRYL